jgi:hypothetical protein
VIAAFTSGSMASRRHGRHRRIPGDASFEQPDHSRHRGTMDAAVARQASLSVSDSPSTARQVAAPSAGPPIPGLGRNPAHG